MTNPFLDAGTQYWLVINVTAAQKLNLAWYENDQGVPGGVWFGNALDGLIEAEAASPAPAFQLDSLESSSVPEPISVILLAAGLAALTIVRVWRRGVRIG